MATTEYEYSISTDTLNNKLDTDSLENEIRGSTITTMPADFVGIGVTDDLFIISVANELSSPDETLLEDLIGAHDGEAPIEPETKVYEGQSAYDKKYKSKGFDLSIGNTEGWHYSANPIIFTYDILLGNATVFLTDGNKHDDRIEFVMAKETTIGTITAQMDSESSEFIVAEATLPYLSIGDHIRIADDTHHQLGEVIEMDGTTITVSGEASENLVSGSVLQKSILMVEDFFIPPIPTGFALQVEIGVGWIGGSRIPAGTSMHIGYYNSETVAKHLCGLLEYKR